MIAVWLLSRIPVWLLRIYKEIKRQIRQRSQRREVIEVEETEEERNLRLRDREEANRILKRFLLNNSDTNNARPDIHVKTGLARRTGLSIGHVTQKLYQMRRTKWYQNRRNE